MNFLINFYIFFKKKCVVQQTNLLLMVEYMVLQNNKSVNFLAKNNLVLYTIEIHHNPKDKI